MNFPEIERQDLVFSGLNYSEKSSKAFIFGVCLEATCSGKKGAALGPNALRKASLDLETYSLNAEREYFENCPTLDLGNLRLEETVEKTLKAVESVVSRILSLKKIPIMLGGEHTITLAALRAFKGEDFVFLHFDADHDLYDELEGVRISHGTFLRRALEEKLVKPENIIKIGARTGTRLELNFLKQQKIQSLKARDLMNAEFFKRAKKSIAEKTKGKKCYITFDVDALDLSLVPATGCPEPGGLNFWQAIELFESIKGKIIGLDVVEVSSDQNLITEISSAKLLYEMLSILKF